MCLLLLFTGTSRTKVIPLRCEVPVQFEFELDLAGPHPDFQVASMAIPWKPCTISFYKRFRLIANPLKILIQKVVPNT